MEDIRDFSLVFEEIPKDIPEENIKKYMDTLGGAMAIILESINKAQPNVVITETIYKSIYEGGMFLQKLGNVDLSGVFEQEKITDARTQMVFKQQLEEQFKRNLSSYLADPKLVTDYFDVDYKKREVRVKFLTDYNRVSDYYINVLNAGCAFQWDEFQKTKQQYIDDDTNEMKKIYESAKKWSKTDDVLSGLEKVRADSPLVFGKYYNVIMGMPRVKFNEPVFRACVDHWYTNLSSSPKEFAVRYFTDATPKDNNYYNNLSSLIEMTIENEKVFAQAESKTALAKSDDNDSDDGEGGGGNTPETQARKRRQFYESCI